MARWEEMGGRIMALVNSAVALKEDLQVELGEEDQDLTLDSKGL